MTAPASRLLPRLLAAGVTADFLVLAVLRPSSCVSWIMVLVGVALTLGAIAWEEIQDQTLRKTVQASEFRRRLLDGLGVQGQPTRISKGDHALALYTDVTKDRKSSRVKANVLHILRMLRSKLTDRNPYSAEWPVEVTKEDRDIAVGLVDSLLEQLDAVPCAKER